MVRTIIEVRCLDVEGWRYFPKASGTLSMSVESLCCLSMLHAMRHGPSWLVCICKDSQELLVVP